MRKLFFLFLLFITSTVSVCSANVCSEWNAIERQIQYQITNKESARHNIIRFHRALVRKYSRNTNGSILIFPVNNCSTKNISDIKKTSFDAQGYDFYDGNDFKGYPGYNIMIDDKNKDTICDINGEPVEVLSFTSGVVIGVNDTWVEGNILRGGHYLWIFNPLSHKYYYYAHLDQLFVKQGDIVKAGQILGFVGRTGREASTQNSSTHLYFMCLDFDDGNMTPYNPYDELYKAFYNIEQLDTKVTRYLWLRDNGEINYRVSDIPCPEGYFRIPHNPHTFDEWLRSLPLRPKGSSVYLFDGRKKPNQDVHYAVVDIDIGNRDLQQCADAIIRLRSEYLYTYEKYDEIKFDFVNGFTAEYNKWRDGYRIRLKGRKSWWINATTYDPEYNAFKSYLTLLFSCANTYSLEKQMLKVSDIRDIQIGNVFIQGGFPGHSVIVVDIAQNEKGNTIFLLAQSFMPAQDIHILKSPDSISPWYQLDFGDKLETPEWKFKKTDLKRF